jgi:hypothetical protein
VSAEQYCWGPHPGGCVRCKPRHSDQNAVRVVRYALPFAIPSFGITTCRSKVAAHKHMLVLWVHPRALVSASALWSPPSSILRKCAKTGMSELPFSLCQMQPCVGCAQQGFCQTISTAVRHVRPKVNVRPIHTVMNHRYHNKPPNQLEDTCKTPAGVDDICAGHHQRCI